MPDENQEAYPELEKTPPVIKRMFSVDSSNIKAIGYNKDEKVLAVTFGGGKTYHYFGFSSGDFAEFCCCDSVGKHLNSVIKPSFDCKPA